MPYSAADDRYDVQPYRRCGRSGLLLPAVSLGFWHNFGDDKPIETQRAIMRRAFDLGVSHFDLANNYGPPYGSAESNVGRILAEDFAGYRDELVISTKAGWDMWPGPYGDLGSRKYLTASLDQSLRRLGVDYVDIFYHHRPDPDTPLEETMGALDSIVRAGKALYVGVSSYSGEHTARAAAILRDLGTPLVIHQPSYSMFNRWIETDLLDVLDAEGIGCIAFTALAQGLLTDRYLDGIPADSRAAAGKSLSTQMINDDNLARIRALNEIAQGRGQTLAQLALAWVLRRVHHDLDPDRRQQRAAARGQRRRRGEARLLRRRAGRHRRARGRVRGGPVGRTRGSRRRSDTTLVVGRTTDVVLGRVIDRRTALLDGAITVLGKQGVRALTHRSADAAAACPDRLGVQLLPDPRGSSRCVVIRIAERESRHLEPARRTPAEDHHRPRARAGRLRGRRHHRAPDAGAGTLRAAGRGG